MAAGPTSATPTAEREILITRVFDAPRELVFDAFIDAEHIGEWWGPAGFRITTRRMEVRPGGDWIFTMHGPDGTDYPNHIVYRRIERPGLLEFVHVDPSGADLFTTIATFIERHGKTHLEFLNVLPSKDARDYVVRHHNAIEGGTQNLARLASHLEHAGEAAHASVQVVNRHVVAAPIERVFEAYADPAQLALWWGPNGFTNTIHEIDFRSGGRWRYTMHGPDGTDYQNESDVVEVITNARIVLHHLRPMHRFVLTMTFERQGARTEIVWRMTFETEAEVATLGSFLHAANEENLGRLERHLLSGSR